MIPAIPHIRGEPFDGRCRRRKTAPPAKNGVRWYCRTQPRHMDESPHCTALRGLTQLARINRDASVTAAAARRPDRCQTPPPPGCGPRDIRAPSRAILVSPVSHGWAKSPRPGLRARLGLRRGLVAAPERVVAIPTRTGAVAELCRFCDEPPYGSTSRYSLTSHSVTSAQYRSHSSRL